MPSDPCHYCGRMVTPEEGSTRSMGYNGAVTVCGLHGWCVYPSYPEVRA